MSSSTDPPADFVHRFVPGALAGAPTMLALHGTGGDENELVPLARMVDGDAAILSLRGRVVEQGHARFFRRISEGVFDIDDLLAQTEALAGFLDAAAARYRFDRSRVVALGYSNGANIAGSLMLTRPGALAAAILLRPVVPFEPATLPALAGMPVLISAGRNDPIAPQASTVRLSELLAQAGANVDLLWQETGHALSPTELEAVSEWWRLTFERRYGSPPA